MTINLPPDPNDAPKAAPAPAYQAPTDQAPTYPPPTGAPLGGSPLPGQPLPGQPSAAQPAAQQPARPSAPAAPVAPAFPDGSRGAAYREPYVVTRRNSSRKWMILGAVGFTVALILGIVLFLFVGIPLMIARP